MSKMQLIHYRSSNNNYPNFFNLVQR